MTQLPLHNLVLYKNGIGYFVREGQLDGDTLKLRFQQDEINDVLKSLSVFDEAGGQVMGIHYETPVDPLVKLANNSIRLSDADSLKTLLRDLRGRQIKAEFEVKENRMESVTGTLIGIDLEDDATRLSIMQKNKRIRVYTLDTLRELAILDEQSENDLLDFLETNKSESDHRVINVQLSEGAHDLAVSYVAPSPNWRVSYRVIAETEENATEGKAVLLGWGLFDNHIEDLENVHVTLVAGNPISFEYDLYSPHIPKREQVKDQAKVGQGPIDYRPAPPPQSKPKAQPKSSGGFFGRNRDPLEERLASFDDDVSFDTLENIELSMSFRDRVALPVLSRAAAVFGQRSRPQKDMQLAGMADKQYHAKRSVSMQQASAAVKTPTEGKDSGEVFQYIVTQPVSVKRGVSALVPIINQPEINCQRELLFNERKLNLHPVATLRMKNTTGFTLERGPVTVVENGDYKGEAVIPFTRDGSELYLPYAVEEGVQIRVSTKSSSEEGGQFIRDVKLLRELYYLADTIYFIENNTKQEKTIRIEANKREHYDLFESAEPEEETDVFRRWSITVAPHSSTEFKFRERKLGERLELIGGGCNPFARLAIWLVRKVHSLPVRPSETRR